MIVIRIWIFLNSCLKSLKLKLRRVNIKLYTIYVFILLGGREYLDFKLFVSRKLNNKFIKVFIIVVSLWV